MKPLRFSQAWASGILVLASACTDTPSAPGERVAAPGWLSTEFVCTVDVSAGSTDCRPALLAQQGPQMDLLPGVGPLTFSGNWTHYRASTADEDTSINTLAFTNNMGQPIGTTDGNSAHPNGNRLFFTTVPAVTAVYSGTVASASIQLDNADGTATFSDPGGTVTYENRPYYQYSGIVSHGAASGSRTIRYIYSANVKSFTYRYRVSTPVQYEHGWITVSPSTVPVLGPGAGTTLTGTAYDGFGAVQADGITWTSSNAAVATVNSSTGVVTAVGEGTATITATSTANAQRTGTRVLTVDAAPTVTSTSPADGAMGVPRGDNVVVTFSEAVNVTASSFTLECPAGLSQAFTVSGSGTSTITLNPSSDLPAATICTLTMSGNQVTDADVNDGPNEMAGNYTYSFEVAIQAFDDVFGQIITGPINTSNTSPAFSVTDNDAITASTTIVFAGWNGVSGLSRQGGNVTMATSGAGMGRFTYAPPAGYQGPDSIQYTVQSGSATSTAKVALVVDRPPAVLSTTPASGGALDVTEDIKVTFTEAVSVSGSSFSLGCTTGPQPVSVSGSGTATITVHPINPPPSGDTCTLTVFAAYVSDGLNQMVANYAFSFEVTGFGF